MCRFAPAALIAGNEQHAHRNRSAAERASLAGTGFNALFVSFSWLLRQLVSVALA
jgi:hypothetical protein